MKKYIITYWNSLHKKEDSYIIEAKNFKKANKIAKGSVKRLKHYGCETRLMRINELTNINDKL